MEKLIITCQEKGQRLDRLIMRRLKAAPAGFVYKMLRKKNITLNGRKASGSEKLMEGDQVCLYLSQETLSRFGGEGAQSADYPFRALDILYEDPHVLIVDKPSGMLSQKASPSDISLSEYLIGYLLHTGQISPESLRTAKPAVCNRLDRNTGGIVICGKTTLGLQEMGRLLKERSLHKYYRCIVSGVLDKRLLLQGYLSKNEDGNQVSLHDTPVPGSVFAEAEYTPLRSGRSLTLIEVRLITGRSHQIRAQLAGIGCPILGDPKYGDPSLNRRCQRQYGVKGQLLKACRLEFPKLSAPELAGLSEAVVTAKEPPVFEKLIREMER